MIVSVDGAIATESDDPKALAKTLVPAADSWLGADRALWTMTIQAEKDALSKIPR